MARPFIRQGLSTFGRVADSAMDPFRKVIDRRSLTVSDHLIFNSEVCRQGWQTHYDFDTPSSVSYNGVDTDQFSRREPSPLTPDEYVLFVGNDERKGLSTVLEYARESTREVVLVGPSTVDVDGATALGRLTPDELAAVYSGATATVHPTGFEAFGNVILESVACGTPVVTTDMCGAAEVLNADCCVITDDLHAGVDRASTLDSADCVAAVADQTWADVANETLDIVECAINRTRQSIV
jgi:glycosyltransferase involved in cell wall biosynthesis